MTIQKIEVRGEGEDVRVSDEEVREAVCQTIKDILLTSPLGSEQLKEIANRMKREIYE